MSAHSVTVMTPNHDKDSLPDEAYMQHYVMGTPLSERVGSETQPRKRYALSVDPEQDDRATEINLLSTTRPHMRAFHYSWISFFFAFFGWFSIPPLMPTIKRELSLTKDQVANSNIAAVASTIVGRVIAGPLCDHYGPRAVQSVVLVLGAIPVACAAFVTDYTGFTVVRLVIGLVGCSFIATTYWTSIMFSREVVGSANAVASGWGNLGAGASYLLMPLLFDAITWRGTISDSMGWRISLVIPAILMVVVGICLYKHADDCPHGNFADLKHRKRRDEGSDPSASSLPHSTMAMLLALRRVTRLSATWILAFQYACSFGVELQVHNVLSLYYYEDFTATDCDPTTRAHKCRLLTQTTASLISSLFGLMCVFARALGGYASDVGNRRFGMVGRVAAQLVMFSGQALTLYAYSQVDDVASSIPLLIVFGIFVQACTGTTFGIVPYVSPRDTGATSGLVGAGGNLGALAWGFLFKGVGSRARSFSYLSIFVAISAMLCLFTCIEGEPSIWTAVGIRPSRPNVRNATSYGSTHEEDHPPQPQTRSFDSDATAGLV